jgi:hypothetical protein
MHRFRVSPRSPAAVPTLPRRRPAHDATPSRAELESILFEDLRLLEPGVVHDGPDYAEEPLVLIVSRERAAALPKLRELLRGEPEISIVVDRRFADRRAQDGDGDPPRERRVAERRRRFSFYLL